MEKKTAILAVVIFAAVVFMLYLLRRIFPDVEAGPFYSVFVPTVLFVGGIVFWIVYKVFLKEDS